METIGDDLVPLAIRPNEVIAAASKLQYALSGSELAGSQHWVDRY